MSTYRDRSRRETLGKLSKQARALHEDLAAWLAEKDEEQPPDPRPARLRARLALRRMEERLLEELRRETLPEGNRGALRKALGAVRRGAVETAVAILEEAYG